MTMNAGGPFPADQHITTGWGVTFTPFHDPDGRVGFRAERAGLIDLVYLAAPVDAGNNRPLTVTAHSRPADADEHDPDDACTTTTAIDLVGPATPAPWTDGHSVGWRIDGLHTTRYVYLFPSVDGDGDVADAHLYVSGSDNPDDAEPVVWLPVHERTATRLVTVEPVTGPGVHFDPDAFTTWFLEPATQQALAGLATGRYDSGDPDDSAALRVQALLTSALPDDVWRLGAGVSGVAIWPTTDPEGAATGDGGGIVTVRVRGVELSAGHLAAADLVPQRYRHRSGTVWATGHDAAAMALAAVAARINATIDAFAAALGRTAEGDQVTGVPVNLVTGWATATVHVDPDLPDALVVVAVGDPHGYQTDIVGVDFNAGTVGVWTGQDPDNREWTVVHHLAPDQVRPTAPPPAVPLPVGSDGSATPNGARW
ncbi:hypothetical protein [Dactylosporangium sp. CA-233914]|uniref:hypothetical protein n=1 Tax=Dactylosporangium sp. CA-233914 TaxID=3239934 RepID=UPI003D8FF186